MSFTWLNPFRRAGGPGHKRPPAARPAKRSTVRLAVEALEDRSVPATYTLTGTTLTIAGTAVNDNFQFLETTQYVNGSLVQNYYFAMNDQTATYNSNQISTVYVDGNGGNDTGILNFTQDTFTVNSQTNAQELQHTVALTGGGGYVDNYQGNVFLVFANFNNTYAYLGPSDKGVLTTPSGPNATLVTAGNYAYTNGGTNNEFHLIQDTQGNFNLTGIATNPSTDVVYHYDTPGFNWFALVGNSYSQMQGSVNGMAFTDTAIGFQKVYGFASQGTGDIATFYDTAATDYFVGTTNYSYMYGTNGTAYYDEAIGFSHVFAEGYNSTINYASVYSTLITTQGNWVYLTPAPRGP